MQLLHFIVHCSLISTSSSSRSSHSTGLSSTIEIKRTLGQGAQGIVHEVCLNNQHNFAMKSVDAEYDRNNNKVKMPKNAVIVDIYQFRF